MGCTTFKSLLQVKGFRNTYILVPLEADNFITYQKRATDITKRLSNDDRILWAEVQQSKQRFKRDFQLGLEPRLRVKRLRGNEKISKRPPIPVYDKTFNDELWVQEWYLVSKISTPILVTM